MAEFFYSEGKCGRMAHIEVEKHGQKATASAEASAITGHQLMTALRERYPDYGWAIETHGDKYFGYRMGYGTRRE